MIFGVGTDVCDLRRVEALLARRGARFPQRVLGAAEMAVYETRRSRWPARGVAYLATRFSAKEAFSKAIGVGMRMPMTWRACEILNERSGRPFIVLSGELARWFDARRLVAHVSLSDESDYATSTVIVESAAA